MPFRRLLDRPALAALIVAAALVLRLLVPAGYMPAVRGDAVMLAICGGIAPAHAGMRHGGGHEQAPEAPRGACAFADLSLPIVGGADPVVLLAAILYVLAVARVLAAAAPRTIPRRLRPPSHAPPLPA